MIRVKLSTHERVLKRNIEEIRAIMEETAKTVVALCEICADHGHHIVPRDLRIDEKLKKDKWASTGAYCAVCGESFGWWCPKSPMHICSYSKSDDDCDYCHMPSERK